MIEIKEAVNRRKPTKEQEAELTEFISQCIEKGYERTRQIYGYGKKIMQFFMLPNTELHNEFRNKICSIDHELKAKKKGEQIQKEMDKNIDRLSSQNPDDTYIYEKINKFSTAEDNYIRIAIPVMNTDEKNRSRVVNKGMIIISQKKTPALYFRFM